MLSCCALIDSAIPQGRDGLHLKTDDVRKFTGLASYFKIHMQVRDYTVTFGKYCQVYDVEEAEFTKVCKPGCPPCCKPVQIDGPVWNQLVKRKPLIPDPEPSPGGAWMTYNQLVDQGETSNKQCVRFGPRAAPNPPLSSQMLGG